MPCIIEEYFAEYATDKYLREHLFPDTATGLVVEVGGATPLHYSMSRHWLLNGWQALIIEPNPHFVRLHQALGHDVIPCACGAKPCEQADFFVVGPPRDSVEDGQLTEHSYSSLGLKPGYQAFAGVTGISDMPHTKIQVPVRTLDSILAERGDPCIDLLTIDVEGWELEVLAGFDLQRHRPDVLVLENFVNDPAYRQYMHDHGYHLIHTIEYNEIYVP